jgi:hypothetical protein
MAGQVPGAVTAWSTQGVCHNGHYENSGCTERFRLWPTRPLAVVYPKAVREPCGPCDGQQDAAPTVRRELGPGY